MLTVGEPARSTELRRGNAASEPVLRKFRECILSEMRGAVERRMEDEE
jgi:hypothetical protein